MTLPAATARALDGVSAAPSVNFPSWMRQGATDGLGTALGIEVRALRAARLPGYALPLGAEGQGTVSRLLLARVLALLPLAVTVLLALPLAGCVLLPLATRHGAVLIAVEVVRSVAFGVTLGE